MSSNRILIVLLCVNVLVTSFLLLKIGTLTIQIQDAKDSFNSAVDTFATIKTLVTGGLIDRAQLMRQGFNNIKESDLISNLKDKLWKK